MIILISENIKVTVIPIIGGTFGKVFENLEKRLGEREIREKIKTIQTTALLKSARVLIIVLENWGDLLSFKLKWKLPVRDGVKNFQTIIVIKTIKSWMTTSLAKVRVKILQFIWPFCTWVIEHTGTKISSSGITGYHPQLIGGPMG